MVALNRFHVKTFGEKPLSALSATTSCPKPISPPVNMPRPSKKKAKRRKRTADPFLSIVRQLQKANHGENQLCSCTNDEENVCEHIWKLALEQLAKTDSDPDDMDSFHASAPASFPTDSRHGTTEREDALWLRIKHGQDTHHSNDRPVDSDNILGSDVVEGEGGEPW